VLLERHDQRQPEDRAVDDPGDVAGIEMSLDGLPQTGGSASRRHAVKYGHGAYANADAGETSMSTLVAIAYPDRETAEKVRQELMQATKEHLLRLEDAVVAVHEADGKIKLHQAASPAGAGAAGGAIWGGLIGLLFLAPLLGMAVGAATGGAVGAMADVGVNDKFMKELGAKMPPGGAALIALGQTDARDKLLERIQPFGGHVIQTSLSNEDEERLRSALEGASA
jgi:uncharacterized membrane protein